MARIWARHGLLGLDFGRETANYIFLHSVLLMGCIILAPYGLFCLKSGLITANSKFLYFYILKFLHGVSLGVPNLGS